MATRCKLFETVGIDLEDQVNTWLKANPDIELLSTQTMAWWSSEKNRGMLGRTITIFYTTTKEPTQP